MLHRFPSLIEAHLLDHMIAIGSHCCLFSRKSLGIVCAKSGFRLARISYRKPPGAYLFVKERDV